MNIGWIGLGNMGRVMAARLLEAGHELSVHNRTRQKAEELLDLGARWAATPADAARSDVLVTMLADDRALTEVLGPGGALAALRPGATHVSMSTISYALSQELMRSHAKGRVRLVGAPVFGRPDVAAQGKLFIVVGGEAAALTACQPFFEVLGQKFLSVGDSPAAAHLTKVLGNFLLISSVELLGEALNVAHASGVDPAAVLSALTGSVFSAPFYGNYGRLLLAQQFDGPAAFTLPLARKDVELAQAAARAANTPLPMAEPLRAKLESLLAGGGEHLDLSVLGKWT